MKMVSKSVILAHNKLFLISFEKNVEIVFKLCNMKKHLIFRIVHNIQYIFNL
jgi:hypothetical protein